MLQALHLFDPAARFIVATLFNSLWEDALLALAVALVLRLAPNVNATTRYAVWIGALAAAIVLPALTTLPLVTTVSHRSAAVVPAASTGASAAQPRTAASTHAMRSATPAEAPSAPRFRLPERFRFSVPPWRAVMLFAVWAFVALGLLVKVIVSLVRLERLKRDSLPLPIEYRDRMSRWAIAQKGGRDVRICVSDKIEVPVAVGLFDAMILMPKHLLDELSQEEIDQISLHELAHLRRGDDWTNGLQRLVQALFFFNPAILWMAQQLDLEREVACDDWVLLQTNDVRPYAFCLTKMAEVTAWPHRALAAPGVFVTRKSLSIRVERLLRGGRDIRTRVTFAPATIVGATVVVLFFVLQSVAPSFAFEQEDTNVVVQDGSQLTEVHDNNHGQRTVHVFTDSKGTIPPPVPALAAPHQIVKIVYRDRRLPALPALPVLPKHPGALPKLPALPKIAAVPQAPRIPDAEQIRVEVDRAMRQADIARVSADAARAATGRLHEFKDNRCIGCDLSGVKWAGRDLRGARLTGADFSRADLHGANFTDAVLAGVDFSNANLRDANFSGAKLAGCDMRGADLTGANLNVASFTGCDVNPSRLSADQARALISRCTGCDFHNADLRNQDLRNVKLTGDDLAGADLRGANLDGATFVGVALTGAKLDGAHLNGTKFSGCDFDGVDLRGVDMSKAVVTGGRFRP